MSGPQASEFDGSEIAICGMAARFPGARDIPAFWENLKNGVESISRLTEEEARAAEEDPETVDDPNYVRMRPILDGVELLDAGLFGFSPREAEILDPQARLLLECAWEALEQAGCDTQRFKGAVGIFAGASFSTYLAHHLYKNRAVMQAFGDVESTMFNIAGTISTMAAYKLNLKGATASVQTFCSTSLVAVHLACQSLLNFESDVALAGGVTVQTPQQRGYIFREGGIVSPDGHCRPFDANAAGTIFGSGVGIIALKRLKDALADRDPIRAIIRGSASNNDGALKASYTAPGVVGQTEVIVEALGAAGVHPESVGFLEAHGTGTKLGDPSEIEAVTKAYRTKTQKSGYCAIGSVKANVGHLDAAAGIAGLVKAVLCLEHRQIPPAINFESANPLIDFARSPFYVNTTLKEWTSTTPRRAGVSAFGVGGTNAHVVLQEAPAPAATAPARSHQLFVLSAKTPTALQQMGRNLAAHLQRTGDDLADAAHTLQTGRREFNFRRAIVAGGREEAIEALNRQVLDEKQAPLAGEVVRQDRRNPPVVFVFPGITAARVNMARGLYDTEKTFREQIDKGSEAASRFLGGDLRAQLYPASNPASAAFDRDEVARASLFVVEHALARLWMSWGVRPESLVGDGIGEFAAACIAGVFSLEDGLKLLLQPGDARLAAPKLPYMSSQTGGTVTPDVAMSANAWAERRVDGANWRSAIATLQADRKRVLLGMSAPQTLDGAIVWSLPTDSGRDVAQVLDAVGQLWLAGVSPDWTAFHAPSKRRRLILPTYPFERQRFWVDPVDDEDDESTDGPLVKAASPAQWLYHPVWKQAVRARTAQESESRRHLVFADRGGVGQQIAAVLARRGHDVIVVSAGAAFTADLNGGFTIDASNRRDYRALFSQLRSQNRLPSAIVHAWSLDPLDRSLPAADQFAAANVTGFDSLRHLAECLAQVPSSSTIELKVLTAGVQDVIGDEPLEPEKATIFGVCRVMPQELQNVRCWTIDLDAASGAMDDAFADKLADEILARPGDTSVAYRNGRRWVQRYEPLPADDSVASRVRPGGVYLVTGGLGNVGFQLAATLVHAVKAKVILTGRSEVPPREQWSDWLDRHGLTDPTSVRIQKLQYVEKVGGEALYVVADASSVDGARAAVAQGVERFGRIDGVIHAAGVVAAETFQPLAQLDQATCARQFAPKVSGLIALDEALAPLDGDIDFVLVTSSLSSVLGGLGYGAYAAGNLFMDAYTAYRNRTSRTAWISVNWDQWQFDLPGAQGAPARTALAALAMTPLEGSEVLGRVLRPLDVRQFVISTASLERRMAAWVALDQVRRPAAHAPAAVHHARPTDLSTAYEEPRTETERAVAGVWREILGIDRVGAQDNFFELGGNSLTAIQVVSRLHDALSIRLSVSAVFESGTVAALAEQLDSTRWAVEHQQSSDDWAASDHEEIEI